MVPIASRRAVLAAAAALLVVSLYGAYRGFRTAWAEADVAAASEGLMPTASALAARQASPLTEPTTAALSEAQIRAIARQEAQSALTAREAPSTPAPAEGGASAVAAPPPPAATTAPAPAPASEANQPPLY